MLTWQTVDALGAALHEAYPDEHPMFLSDDEMRHMIRELSSFAPETSEPTGTDHLEAIRDAWFAEMSASC